MRALVIINGDDVYEDLFTAALKLAEPLTGAGFAVRTAMGTGRISGEPADLIVLATALGEFPDQHRQALAAQVARGTGLLAIHAANVSPPDHELIGSRYLDHGPEPHHSRFRVHTDPVHPVTRTIPAFDITHEHYRIEVRPDVTVIAWRHTDDGREPIAYVRRTGRGRVGYLQLGHDMGAWDEPGVRDLVRNTARWTTGGDRLCES